MACRRFVERLSHLLTHLPPPASRRHAPTGTAAEKVPCRCVLGATQAVSHYAKFALMGVAVSVLLGGGLWLHRITQRPPPGAGGAAEGREGTTAGAEVPPEAPGPDQGPAPQPVSETSPTFARVTAGPVPTDAAVLGLDLPSGTTVAIGGRQFGAARAFRFHPLAPGRWYRYELAARFPSGEVEPRTLLVQAGRRARLGLAGPRSRGPEIVLPTGHTAPVPAVAFNPDGNTVLTVSQDMSAILWEADTGKQLRTFRGHRDFLTSAAFSRDGRQVLTGSKDGTAILWETATGKRVRSFTGHTNSVNSVAFSPDGRRVLTGPTDATAVLWDVASGERVCTLDGHAGPVSSVAFSPDGRALATASEDRTAILWGADTGQPLRTLRGHGGRVTAVAFSADSRLVLTGSEDGTAILWGARTGRRRHTLGGHEGPVSAVAFSPDGGMAATGSRGEALRLWDSATGRHRRDLPVPGGTLVSVAFSPKGERLLTNSWPATTNLWQVATGKRLQTYQARTSSVTSLALRSEGGEALLTGSGDGVAVLWDGATGRRRHVFLGHTKPVTSVAFSPDGRQALTASQDETASVWDIATGKRQQVLQGHTAPVEAVAFSPDGRTALTGSQDETARLWDVATGRQLRELRKHTGFVAAVAFSPDGRRALTGSWDGTAVLWDVAAGKELRVLGGHPDYVTCVAFSPDGRAVATGCWDGVARLWPAAGGGPRALEGHRRGLAAVAFSPDGSLLLTGSQDKTAALWDVASGRRLRGFQGHASTVTSLQFGADGQHVLTGSAGGTVRLWDVASGDELAQLIKLDQGSNWVVVTADGLFDGSPEGRNAVCFREGDGLHTVPLDRFFQDFYRSRLWARARSGDLRPSGRDLFARPPPAVRVVEGSAADATGRKDRVVVRVKVQDRGGGVRGPWLKNNGVSVRGEALVRDGPTAYQCRFVVPLVRGMNRIEVWAASDSSWESERVVLGPIPFDGELPAPKLYVLAIGITRYAPAAGFQDLKFGVADAEAMADLFRRQHSRDYGALAVTPLLDENATKENILAALRRIADLAEAQDTLVFYASCHGELLGQRYFLVPHDCSPSPRQGEDRDRPTRTENFHRRALAIDELGDALSAVRARKRVLIFDTCYSGGAGVLADRQPGAFAFGYAVEQVQRAQGVYTLAASGPIEFALEHERLRHSILAYTLLAGVRAVRAGPLEGQSLRPGRPGGSVDVLEWFRYARLRAPALYRDLASRSQEIVLSGEDQPSFPLLELGAD
jgi:WD40 repeat protein